MRVLQTPSLHHSNTAFLVCLTFAVLETFARTGLAVFLALAHARIAGEQPFGLEGRPQIGIDGEQGPGQPVAHGPGLTIRPAAANFDFRIVLFSSAGDSKRLRGDHAQRLDWEIIFKGAAIDYNLAVSAD